MLLVHQYGLHGVRIVQQQLHDVGVAALRRLDQHRRVVLQLVVGVGIVAQQQLDDGEVAAGAGQRQRRVVIVRRLSAHVCTLNKKNNNK